MENQVNLKTYQEVLQELENNSNDNHLLLGNGFNNSLGIKTDYKSIFKEMKKEYQRYSVVEDVLSQHRYDIETLIYEFKKKIQDDDFLPEYVERRIKADFMKATYNIVREEIKGIYQEKNQGIYLLLKQFTNYFTLNYDPLLYLLLMKFKKDTGDESIALAFQNTLLFQEKDLDLTQNNIYNEIKKARRDGSLSITVAESKTQKNLSQCTKVEFTSAVKSHFNNKEWTSKDIKRAINILWENENQKPKLDNVNDGFLFEEFRPEKGALQNIFFLHGAFHIYKDKALVKKITQKEDKALYERLKKIINDEKKDIVCIFTGSSEDKKSRIDENNYLRECFEKLSTLSGRLVIIGSSLDKNDTHIFEQINKSKISTIFISSCEEKKEQDSQNAKEGFPNKEIILFDYRTISYEQ